MKHIWLRSAAVVAVGLMGSIGGIVPRAWADVATGVWTTGTWSSFTRSSNNLLCPRYLVKDSTSGANDFLFCEGSSFSSGQFAGNRNLTWAFPSAAKIVGAKVYTSWSDDGRVDINLTSIDVKYSEDGEWVSLGNSGVSHVHSSSQTKLYAGFAAEDGTSALAEGVVAVRFVFPSQQNNGVGYAEVEILGELEVADPLPESEYVWEAAGYNASAWEPLVAKSNMMSYCTSILKNGAATTSYDGTKDKTVEMFSAYVGSGTTMTWMFGEAINLQSFSIFSRWKDNGRDSIAVLGFETLGEDGVWTQHFGIENEESWCLIGTPSGRDTATGNGISNYATLRRKDGAVLATGVKGVRVISYLGDSTDNGACWVEVEAEGWIDATNAYFDDSSVTVSNDCWDVSWTARLVSLGASDEVTVNLWTSLDGVNYTIADTKVVTEVDTPYAFTQTLDDVDQTLYYKFETVNTKGEKTWYTTNTVRSVVNHNNATFVWKSGVTSGAWEDAANWTNSKNDARLTWPTGEYSTADFSQVEAGAEVTVTVGASHSPMIKFPSADVVLTLKGESAVELAMKNTDLTGRVIVDGLSLKLPDSVTFGDGARLVAQNGAAVTASGCNLVGQKSGIELLSGATLSCSMSRQNDYFYLSGDSEIVVNGGEVSNAGYFMWAGSTTPRTGRIVFGTQGGVFKAPGAHTMPSGGTCTFRYELPGGDWKGYEEAPLQPTRVNLNHQFGRADGAFHVEVVDGEASKATRELEIQLIEMPQGSIADNTIYTNTFSFAAYGEALDVNVANKKGDYFYWTYDGGDATEPATAGTLPTGLRFHHARRGGFCIRIQ